MNNGDDATHVRRGRLVFLCGPMFAGKTTELLRRARVEAQRRQNRVVLLLSGADTRNPAAAAAGRPMFTHSGERPLDEDRYKVIRYSGPLTADLVPADATHVLLDEVQMLDVETVDAVLWRAWTLGRGLHVTAAGLMFMGCWRRGTESSMFPSARRLHERADQVAELTAICACGEETRFTACVAAEIRDATPLVGGADKYVAMCNACLEARYPPEPPSASLGFVRVSAHVDSAM